MQDRSGTGVTLDERRLNMLLRYGNKLAVGREAGRVTTCAVSGLGELVPLELFEGYLANRWIEDVARGERFGISELGRKQLR